MANKLFAPQVQAVQPAFIYTDTSERRVTISFSLSDFNSKEDFNKINYKVTDPNVQAGWGNDVIKTGSVNGNNLSFSIVFNDTERLVTDQYYQVQIQLENGQEKSDWSQVTLIRPIKNFSLILGDFSNDVNNPTEKSAFPEKIIGRMDYGENFSQEFVQEVGLKIFVKRNEQLVYNFPLKKNFLGTQFEIDTSGIVLEGEYYMCPQIVTKNGYTINDQTYKYYFKVTGENGIAPSDKDFNFNNFLIEKNIIAGSISFSFDFKSSETVFIGDGELKILRASADNNFLNWKEVFKTNVVSVLSIRFQWQDFLIEAGNVYRYKIIFISTSGDAFVFEKYLDIDSQEESLIEIEADFEDIFLSDKNSQLAIRYNPKITNLKWVTQDSITNSLGGKYPIVRKNGDTYYRQFSISGTLSFFEETKFNDLSAKDSRNISMSTWLDEPENSWYFGLNDIPNISHFLSKSFILEKKLRDLALAFLTNGQAKLFKSATEGNIIVYLNNVSFTPNAQLGRNVYDFSATATEVCEATLENIKRYALEVSETDFYYILQANVNTAIVDEENKVSIYFPPYIDSNDYIYAVDNGLQLIALTEEEFRDWLKPTFEE